MVVSIKSSTVAANNSGTASWTVVTAETIATAVGDVVVVVHCNNYYLYSNMSTPTATGSPTMNAIAGASADGGTDTAHIKSWWYVANTAGAQTITAAETGAHDEERCVFAIVYSSADNTSPIDASGATATVQAASTSCIAPSISPATTDAHLLTFTIGGEGTPAGPYTSPGGTTELLDFAVTGIWTGTVGGKLLSASGATGTTTFTASVAKSYLAASIAIKAAAGSAGYPFVNLATIPNYG